MALNALLLLLFAVFRRTEQWMHQHIFKVGWLLTHNRKTTIVFYYCAFLPGILLHELCRWLIAGILNVRATRLAQLPEDDEIGKLQLRLVQISPNARAAMQMCIEAAPVLVAVTALWLIATDVLDLESSLRMATGGSIADVGRAIENLVAQPDFWLWFYLIFTIANTMLPPISRESPNRHRLTSLVIVTVTFVIGMGSGIENMAILGAHLRRMLISLSFILFATSFINTVMALALGLIEAVIESVTGHSATFEDGKLITRTRQQALAERGNQKRASRPRPISRVASHADRPLRSIYALPLPIPGPPGKEPVSKPVAAVLNLAHKQDRNSKSATDRKRASVVAGVSTDKSGELSSRPKRMPEAMEKPAIDPARGRVSAPIRQRIDAPSAAQSSSNTVLDNVDQDTVERAPFSRPFAAPPENVVSSDELLESQSAGTGFSRPFSPPNNSPPALEAEDSVSNSTVRASDEESPAHGSKPESVRRKAMTRAVPKPSKRRQHDDIDSKSNEDR